MLMRSLKSPSGLRRRPPLAGRALVTSLTLLLWGCTCSSNVTPPSVEDAGACVCPAPPAEASASVPKLAPKHQEPSHGTPHVHPLAVCDGKGQLPLDAAREAFDAR